MPQLQELKLKRKDELLIILQQVQDLASGNEINWKTKIEKSQNINKYLYV